MTLSVSENVSGVQPQTILPIYAILARPVFDNEVGGVRHCRAVYLFVNLFLRTAMFFHFPHICCTDLVFKTAFCSLSPLPGMCPNCF